ncbi:MAG: GNAT family N-acetyltransferase [Pseudomonadota bacterium]
MIALEPPYRMARAEDGPRLAELVNYAGHGLPLYVWQGLAKPGEDPWEVGRRRQVERAATGKVIVADRGKGALAALTGYALSPEPEEIGPDMPEVFRPLVELENEVRGTWYVNILATVPEARGQGFGTALLALAERLAADEGLSRMSVIVAGDNGGARRLYERCGYRETARRPCIHGDWQSETEDWVLLVK